MKPSIYQEFPRVLLDTRHWPSVVLDKAPVWCSVDLSEGVQALPHTMSEEKRINVFRLLTNIGVKDIEIGCPGCSEADYNFSRTLIEQALIPDDTTIQVMSQMKQEQLDKTFRAIKGAKKVIVHLFQSTSALRRDAIYANHSEEDIIQRAVNSLSYAKEKAKKQPETRFVFQYSPEGFNTTEPSLLIKACLAVIEVMQPSDTFPLIINLLAAVESDLPNVFADQVEHVMSELGSFPYVTVSVRAHNDRGTAVASTELALLAGANRVEGSLLGSGSRAGCASLVTLALNLYSQGVMPGLELSDVNEIVATLEESTGFSVEKRHPYVGEFAFSAFSSYEQYAIKEAFDSFNHSDKTHWHVPYLPMNPFDIGRDNDHVIRLNHLSGRTGVAFVMKKHHGYVLPKSLQKEFCFIAKSYAQTLDGELTADSLRELFLKTYVSQEQPTELRAICFEKDEQDPLKLRCQAKLSYQNVIYQIKGEGNGALHAVLNALIDTLSLTIEIDDYCQHALGQGAEAQAVSYVKLSDEHDNKIWGVGVDTDATLANIRALISAVNRKMEVK